MLTEPVTCSSCGAVSVNGGTVHCHRCFTNAQQGVGEGITRPHGFDPEKCPTFYDGCNCTVESLVHNIKRAEKAEAERDNFRQGFDEVSRTHHETLINCNEALVRVAKLERFICHSGGLVNEWAKSCPFGTKLTDHIKGELHDYLKRNP